MPHKCPTDFSPAKRSLEELSSLGGMNGIDYAMDE
jgi:hypothetical protein